MHPKTNFSTECSSLTFSYTTAFCLTLCHSKILFFVWLQRIKCFLINTAIFLSHYLKGKSTEPQWSERSVRETRLAYLLVTKIRAWMVADGKESLITSALFLLLHTRAKPHSCQRSYTLLKIPESFLHSTHHFLIFSLNKAAPRAIRAGSWIRETMRSCLWRPLPQE